MTTHLAMLGRALADALELRPEALEEGDDAPSFEGAKSGRRKPRARGPAFGTGKGYRAGRSWRPYAAGRQSAGRGAA